MEKNAGWLLASVLFVFLTSPFLRAQETVDFTYELPGEGTTFSHTETEKNNMNMKAVMGEREIGTMVKNEKTTKKFETELLKKKNNEAQKIRVEYREAVKTKETRNTMGGRNKSSSDETAQPVEGNEYFATRNEDYDEEEEDGEGNREWIVADPDGNEVPEKEAEIVRSDVTSTIKDDSFKEFLLDNEFTVGEETEVPEEVVESWRDDLAADPDMKGTLSDMSFEVTSVDEENGMEVATFQMNTTLTMNPSDAKTGMDMKIAIDFTMTGKTDTATMNRVVEMKIDGPVEISGSQEVSNQGRTMTIEWGGGGKMEMHMKRTPTSETGSDPSEDTEGDGDSW